MAPICGALGFTGIGWDGVGLRGPFPLFGEVGPDGGLLGVGGSFGLVCLWGWGGLGSVGLCGRGDPDWV